MPRALKPTNGKRRSQMHSSRGLIRPHYLLAHSIVGSDSSSEALTMLRYYQDNNIKPGILVCGKKLKNNVSEQKWSESRQARGASFKQPKLRAKTATTTTDETDTKERQ
jgi:hypothetical protein